MGVSFPVIFDETFVGAAPDADTTAVSHQGMVVTRTATQAPESTEVSPNA